MSTLEIFPLTKLIVPRVDALLKLSQCTSFSNITYKMEGHRNWGKITCVVAQEAPSLYI